jgi:hypothetical protein
VGASIFIFAQQLAVTGCGMAPRAGNMVAAIEAETAKPSKSRNIARIRRQITASTIPSQSQKSAGVIRYFACMGLLQLAMKIRAQGGSPSSSSLGLPGAATAGKINAMPLSVSNRSFDGQLIIRDFPAKKDGIIPSNFR